MFDPPSPSLNMSAVIRDMLNEERELLTVLGQDFLSEHLTYVEARLARWQRYLANQYGPAEQPPRGDADRLRAYQIEHELIKRLVVESQSEPFPAVHRRVLKRVRQRLRLLVTRRDFANPALRAPRFEAHLEQELLLELWPKWHAWLRPQTTRHRLPENGSSKPDKSRIHDG